MVAADELSKGLFAMSKAFTPFVFYHHHQRLRAVIVDNQPWFVAHDFAQLIGLADAVPLLPPWSHTSSRRSAWVTATTSTKRWW